jgi:zinc protease
VQTDKTAEALKEFFIELEAILKPVPPTNWRGRRITSRSASRARSRPPATSRGGSRTCSCYHLPDDYFSNYVQNIQAITSADVQRVAQKYIQPGKLAVVVVGDLKSIEAGVRALNLGRSG